MHCGSSTSDAAGQYSHAAWAAVGIDGLMGWFPCTDSLWVVSIGEVCLLRRVPEQQKCAAPFVWGVGLWLTTADSQLANLFVHCLECAWTWCRDCWATSGVFGYAAVAQPGRGGALLTGHGAVTFSQQASLQAAGRVCGRCLDDHNLSTLAQNKHMLADESKSATGAGQQLLGTLLLVQL